MNTPAMAITVTPLGDTATLSKIRIHGDSKKKIETCVRFTGNSTGKEPEKLSPVGPYGKTCDFTGCTHRFRP